MDSKVSVVVPVYNPKFLQEAVRSILEQTYDNIEIIVVDDGSEYDIPKKLADFSVRYIRQENRGPAAARNTGIKNATGSYVAFLDADDLWLPQKIEKQMQLFEKNTEAGFTYCDNFFITENGTELIDYSRKIEPEKKDILLAMFLKFVLITSAVIVKKSCFEQIGFFNEDLYIGEDIDFFLRLSEKYKADFLDEKMLKRRVWNGGISRQDYIFNANEVIRIHKDFLKNCPDFYHSNKEKIDSRIAEMHFNLGYRYLESGKNISALKQFWFSLMLRSRSVAIKNLFLSFLPFRFRKFLKTQKVRLNYEN